MKKILSISLVLIVLVLKLNAQEPVPRDIYNRDIKIRDDKIENLEKEVNKLKNKRIINKTVDSTNNKHRIKNKALNKENKDLKNQIDSMGKEMGNLKGQIKNLLDTKKAAISEKDSAIKQRNRLQDSLNTVNSELGPTKKKRDELNSEVDTLKNELGRTRTQLNDSSKKLVIMAEKESNMRNLMISLLQSRIEDLTSSTNYDEKVIDTVINSFKTDAKSFLPEPVYKKHQSQLEQFRSLSVNFNKAKDVLRDKYNKDKCDKAITGLKTVVSFNDYQKKQIENLNKLLGDYEKITTTYSDKIDAARSFCATMSDPVKFVNSIKKFIKKSVAPEYKFLHGQIPLLEKDQCRYVFK